MPRAALSARHGRVAEGDFLEFSDPFCIGPLGDLMFWWLLQPLIDEPEPLLTISNTRQEWPHHRLELTELGRSVLEGRCKRMTDVSGG